MMRRLNEWTAGAVYGLAVYVVGGAVGRVVWQAFGLGPLGAVVVWLVAGYVGVWYGDRAVTRICRWIEEGR